MLMSQTSSWILAADLCLACSYKQLRGKMVQAATPPECLLGARPYGERTHFSFAPAQCCRFHAHHVDGETEAQRGQATRLKSHSQQVAELSLEPRPSVSRGPACIHCASSLSGDAASRDCPLAAGRGKEEGSLLREEPPLAPCPGCALTWETALPLPKWGPPFPLSLGVHSAPAPAPHPNALQRGRQGCHGDGPDLTPHMASSLIYGSGAFAGDVRNSVGISRCLANRAGFDIFTSGAPGRERGRL